MNIDDIMKTIPHRYPFLLIDKLTQLESGKSAVGIKNVTINEYFFQGHFPMMPVMPGVLIVEALAQLGAVMVLSSDQFKGKIAVFTGIDGFRFRKQVVPGDQLKMEAQFLKMRANIGKAAVKATVNDEVAAEGEIMFALVDSVGVTDETSRSHSPV